MIIDDRSGWQRHTPFNAPATYSAGTLDSISNGCGGIGGHREGETVGLVGMRGHCVGG